jgi:hypothetical protein
MTNHFTPPFIQKFFSTLQLKMWAFGLLFLFMASGLCGQMVSTVQLQHLDGDDKLMPAVSDQPKEVFDDDASFGSEVKGKPGIEKQCDVAIYPNPVQKTLNIECKMVEAGKAEIALIDLSGKTLFTLRKAFHKGVNLLKVDVSSMHRGMYLFSIESNHQQSSKRILLR